MKYDIGVETERIRKALARLKQTQKPGEISGSLGGKKDVLGGVRDEIAGLLKEGYTPKQIAEAMKSDTFGILPKTVTELISAGTTKCRKRRNEEARPATNADQNVAANASANRRDNAARNVTATENKYDNEENKQAKRGGQFVVAADTSNDTL